jgi:mechanosensitive ion channel-like protein
MPVVQPINDWGDAILLALTNALNTFLAAIPGVIGALLIILIGWVLSGFIGRLVARGLRAVGADRLFAEHGQGVYPAQAMKYPPSQVAGEIVKWVIRIIFLIAAANVLGMPQVSELLNQVLLWIPNLLVAVVILLVAPLLARFVRGAVETAADGMGFTNGALLGRIAQIAIIAFAVIVAIDQVGIAADLVNTLFVGVVAAFAIAFGLAFGLGGRDVAAQITQKWYESTQETADRLKERAGEVAKAATPPAGRREARTTAAAAVRASDTSTE